jgi:ribulose-phosphate 3-epimerase
MLKFIPTLLCANRINIEKDIKELDRANADMYHIDVMDGHFVPNLGFSLDEIKQMKGITNTPFDVHLMVDEPENYIDELVNLKVEYISFHLEAVKYPLRLIKETKDKGVKIGVVLSPLTSVDLLSYFIKELDYLVLMTVEPGYSGQQFIKGMFNKIENAKKMIDDKGLGISIEIDGDINQDTGPICVKKGADMLICGATSIFKSNTNLYNEYNAFKNSVLSNS